ncbi:hypothetical protein N7491_006308 [Penicillium cf. griseofulvum]|uniref:Uncharacterized protein n=1 Tax=Penicillium cf. griseofulvum TaxID=2972120 RepID=A0A9W9IX87_9EURO|nr:hypothetical protein N7472_010662 [Penicillium cf. griseofulvum]KAJ5429292.1 hypothetical protein N7491_006308 [Penicillium cf. griseofulvum]
MSQLSYSTGDNHPHETFDEQFDQLASNKNDTTIFSNRTDINPPLRYHEIDTTTPDNQQFSPDNH